MRPQSSIIEINSSPEPEGQHVPNAQVTRSMSRLRSCSPSQLHSKTNQRKVPTAATSQPGGSKAKTTEKTKTNENIKTNEKGKGKKVLGTVIELTDSSDDENFPLRLAPKRPPGSQPLSLSQPFSLPSSQPSRTQPSSQPSKTTTTNAVASGSGARSGAGLKSTQRDPQYMEKFLSDPTSPSSPEGATWKGKLPAGHTSPVKDNNIEDAESDDDNDEDDGELEGYALVFIDNGTFGANTKTNTKAKTKTTGRKAGPFRVIAQTPARNNPKDKERTPTNNAPARPILAPAASATPTPRAAPATRNANQVHVHSPPQAQNAPHRHTMEPRVAGELLAALDAHEAPARPHVPVPAPTPVPPAPAPAHIPASPVVAQPPAPAPAPPPQQQQPLRQPQQVQPPVAAPPPTQPAPPTRPRAEIIASATTQILEIIPNIERAYLSAVLETNVDKLGERTTEAVLGAIFEGQVDIPREVPGAGGAGGGGGGGGGADNEKGKGRAREEDVAGQPDAKRAKIDYASVDRPHHGGVRYQNLTLLALGCSFPYIPKPYIRQTLLKHKGHYAPTHFALRREEAKGEGEAREYVQKSIPVNVPRERGKLEGCRGMDAIFDEEREWVVVQEAEGVRNGGQNQEVQQEEGVQEDVGQAQDKGKGKEKAMAEDEDSLEDGMGIECQCCFGEFAFHKMVQCPEAHLFCLDCISQYAKTQLGSHNPSLICMHSSGCALPFPVSELKRVLDEKLMDLYDRVTQAKAIEEAEIEGLEECPFCEWKCVWEVGEEEQTRFWCGNKERCGVVSCRRCKKKDHLPKTCEEAEADKHLGGRIAIEEAMTRALMRNCPKCQKAFIKEQGCNKMTCPNCRTMSCYICRQVITGYDHFTQNQRGQPHPSTSKPNPTTKCILWDEVDARHANEVKEAAEKAIAEYKRDHPDVEDEEIKVDIPMAPPPAASAAGAGVGVGGLGHGLGLGLGVPPAFLGRMNELQRQQLMHPGVNPMMFGGAGAMGHGLPGAAAPYMGMGLMDRMDRFHAHHGMGLGEVPGMGGAAAFDAQIQAQLQAQRAAIQVAHEREAIRREARRVAAADAKERKRQRRAELELELELERSEALRRARFIGRMEAQEEGRVRAEDVRLERERERELEREREREREQERERERIRERAVDMGRIRAAEAARVEAENQRVARVQARMQAEVQNMGRGHGQPHHAQQAHAQTLALQQAQARASAEAKAQRGALAKVQRRAERDKAKAAKKK